MHGSNHDEVRVGASTPAVISWSSGKDSAFALHEACRAGALEIVGALTTVSEAYRRVAMHGVRVELLARQMQALDIPSISIPLPTPCSNAIYDDRMRGALDELRARGVRDVVFGDLFLEDIRAYREAKMVEADFQPHFPLWGRDTARLAREMIEAGVVAHLVCVDPGKLDRSFAGRRFDEELLSDLPAGVDPCGENGEFHTVVVDGPMFRQPIDVAIGEVVERDGFVFADVIPIDAAG